MSLPHLLLGLLAKPSSGYDLKKEFGQGVRHFWSAELSQIYPALTRLEEEGLLRSEYQSSDRGPRRKVYRRTATGRKELVEWLEAGPVHSQERLGYLTQLYFLGAVPRQRRILFMEQLKAGFQARLEGLEAIEDGWKSDDPRYPDRLTDEDFYPQLTLRLGLAKLRTLVEWCDECLARIRRRK